MLYGYAPRGRLMLTLIGGFAEFEREPIRACISEGRSAPSREAFRWGPLARRQSEAALVRPTGPLARRCNLISRGGSMFRGVLLRGLGDKY